MAESNTRKIRRINKDNFNELPRHIQQAFINRMRKIHCIKKDRISELPQHILEIILCFLPIQDAVRTSILSKKWRHCWTTIPHLIFDEEFSMWLRRYGDAEIKAIKFVSVVNRLLLLHNGPILKFSFMLPSRREAEDYDGEIVNDFIEQWIALFSRKGIKQLTLEEDDELGEFMAHNFSSLRLTHLRLTHAHVVFPYTPASGGFTNLINLQLVLVTSTFGRSILDCPALEKLTLIICKEILPIDFHAPNLKCLHQVYGAEITLEDAFAGLENLTEYSCILQYYQETQTETYNVVNVLGSLHKIEKFSTGMDFLMYLAAGSCPDRLSKPMCYLKTLSICEMNFADLSKVSCLLCLIRSAPNLRELHISCDPYDGEDLKNYWIEDSEDCNVDHLEIVTFSNFKGLQAELELVKFLLGHTPLLKTMSIHRSADIEKDTMAEVMLQYSTASSRAQIRHLEHPVTIDEFEFEHWME